MATRKVTLSLDTASLEFAERAAKAHGISVSSWLSKAARREAVRTGYTPHAPTHSEASEADAYALAAADELERMKAEEDMRAEG